MNKINKIYLLIIAIAFLASCEKPVTNVDVPEVEAQLVLFSFISPENNYTAVSVSLSQPIFGKKNGNSGNNIVSNALVTITELQTNTSANLIYTDSLQEYTISKNTFAIRPGFSYKISASALGKTAEGSTTIVKDTISFTEANWFSFGNSTNGNTPNGKFIYKWQDLTSVKNYYRVVTQLEEDMRFGDYTYNICDNMYDDASYDGKTMQSTCEDYTYRSDTSTVSIFLLNADKHYYEFMRRRLNYIYDDPFSEPTPQYNNVTGGLGVVCSYRFTLKKIKIY